MKLYRKIITYVLIIAIIISSFIYSASAEYTNDALSLWDWLKAKLVDEVSGLSIIDTLVGTDLAGFSVYMNDEYDGYCTLSSDNYHHCDIEDVYYAHDEYYGVCKYCDKDFSISSSDIKEAYNNYLISTLTEDASGNSKPYLTLNHIDEDGDVWYLIHGLEFISCPESTESMSISHSETNSSFTINYTNILSYATTHACTVTYGLDLSQILAPIDGDYDLTYRSNGTSIRTDTQESIAWPSFQFYVDNDTSSSSILLPGTLGVMFEGNSITCNKVDYKYFKARFRKGASFNGISAFYLVCTPSNATAYDYSTRIGSMNGTVNFVGDDNVVTVYEDCTFVDEPNGSLYNPATGETIFYNSFGYDYANMSYNFGTADGESYTLTYGEDKITLYQQYTENGNIINNTYNYYYGDGTGTGTGESDGSTSWLDWLKERLQNILGYLIDEIFEWLADVIGDVLNMVWDLAKGVFGFFTDALDNMGTTISDFFDALGDGDGSAFNFDGVSYDYERVIPASYRWLYG